MQSLSLLKIFVVLNHTVYLGIARYFIVINNELLLFCDINSAYCDYLYFDLSMYKNGA